MIVKWVSGGDIVLSVSGGLVVLYFMVMRCTLWMR